MFAPKIKLRLRWPKKCPVGQLLLGSVLLAAGGLAASYAWDLRSSAATREMLARSQAEQIENQREAHIKMLAFELLQNSLMLRQSAFTETDEEKLQKFLIYPSLSDDALTALITSGLFVGPDDLKLLTAASTLKITMQRFENIVATVQVQMHRNIKGTGRAILRASLTDAPATKELLAAIAKLAEALDETGLFDDQPVKLKPMIESKWQFDREGDDVVWHFGGVEIGRAPGADNEGQGEATAPQPGVGN